LPDSDQASIVLPVSQLCNFYG